MVGFNTDGTAANTNTVYTIPQITQLGRYTSNGYTANDNFKILPGRDPLEFNVAGYGCNCVTSQVGVGPGMSFAYTYYQNTGRSVLLVPCAVGGTGFTSTPSWNPVNMNDPASATSGSYYYDCVNRTNYVLSLPGYQLGGILWDQGENDVGISQGAYVLDAVNMVSAFRSDLLGASATTPFIAGEMVPAWVAGQGSGAAGIQNVIDLTPFNLTTSSVVYGSTPYGLSMPSGTFAYNIHYSAQWQRQRGVLYYTALLAAQQNVLGSVTPGPIVQTFASTLANGNTAISWTPDHIAVSYHITLNGVQYTTSIPSTSLAAGTTNTAPCTFYNLQVAGVGPTGVSGMPSIMNTFVTPCPSESEVFFPLSGNYSDVLGPSLAAPYYQGVDSCAVRFASGVLPSGHTGLYWVEPCTTQAQGIVTNVYPNAGDWSISLWLLALSPTFAAQAFLGGQIIASVVGSTTTATLSITVNGVAVITGGALPVNAVTSWTLFTLTYTTSTQTLIVYINSSSWFTISGVSWGTNITPLQLGGSPALTPFVGGISNARIYNSALSSAAISALYSADVG